MTHLSAVASDDGPAERQVGNYRIIPAIARGGMAIVFLAEQPALGREVALKELALLGTDDSLTERFLLESRLAGSLSHPNIVHVYDYFDHENKPYIAMEYLERGSLREYIGRLTVPQVAGVLEGVLAGLALAETRQIVHRDLKPENLLLTSEGRTKIADFGIAKAYGVLCQHLTATGTTMGTPGYMCPEQAMGHDLDACADLYSVGVVAFELLSGRLPFEERDNQPWAVLMRHINELP